MNVFIRELRAYRNSTIIWAASLSILAFIFLLIFPAFTNDVGTSRTILASLPEALRTAVDLSLQNFFTIYGFFAYLFTFVALAAAVQAMNLGVGVLSKEESGKTVDFLLTKPISRTKVFISKLMAITFLLVITNIVFSAVSLVSAIMVSPDAFDYKIFLLLSGLMLLIQLIFMALGILMSVIIPKIKSVITVTLPTVFTFFIIGTLGAIIGNDNVKYLSPFKFYSSDYIISHSAYETKFLIIEAVIVVVAIIISYMIYIKKDIRSAL